MSKYEGWTIEQLRAVDCSKMSMAELNEIGDAIDGHCPYRWQVVEILEDGKVIDIGRVAHVHGAMHSRWFHVIGEKSGYDWLGGYGKNRDWRIPEPGTRAPKLPAHAFIE